MNILSRTYVNNILTEKAGFFDYHAWVYDWAFRHAQPTRLRFSPYNTFVYNTYRNTMHGYEYRRR